MEARSFSHNEGGCEKFPPFKREGRKEFYPVLMGVGTQKDFPIL